VTAGLALLFGLIMSGAVRVLLPGLSSGGLGMLELRAAKTVNLVVGILSLQALMFVPSIIDNLYRLVTRAGRRDRLEST
jgi:hypothetical protein